MGHMSWLHMRDSVLDFIFTITFDQILLSGLCCAALYKTLTHVLPDDVAGPGGWLIDTGE